MFTNIKRYLYLGLLAPIPFLAHASYEHPQSFHYQFHQNSSFQKTREVVHTLKNDYHSSHVIGKDFIALERFVIIDKNSYQLMLIDQEDDLEGKVTNLYVNVISGDDSLQVMDLSADGICDLMLIKRKNKNITDEAEFVYVPKYTPELKEKSQRHYDTILTALHNHYASSTGIKHR